MHYTPDLNPPAEQTGEDANSALEKCKNSVGTPVDAVPTLRINTQPAHPVELADGSHHRSWVPLGLAPALIQGLKADCLVGSNSERSQSEREVSEVSDEVPMGKTGKNEVPAGIPPGSQQTLCSTGQQQQLLLMRHQPWGSGEDDPHWGPRPA